MKTVLCSFNASYTHTAYSLYALAPYARIAGFEVELMQFTINQNTDSICSALYSTGAEVFMFSCYIWNIEQTLKVASDLKKITECKIILGGSEVFFEWEKYTELDYIDAVASGEGEAVIAPLLEAIKSGVDIGRVENVHTAAFHAKDIPCRPFDFSERIFPYTEPELKALSDKIIYYETTRGCVNNCAFCISSLDKNMRALSVQRVKAELDIFAAQGVKLVKFIDRTFNYDAKRAEEIVSFIIERNYPARFHFEIKAELLTQKLIDLFASSPTGMFQLEIGLQSINDEVLKTIRRHNNQAEFSRIFSLLRKNNNIHLHADLIAMLPNESLQTFTKGYDYLYSLKPHMLQLGFLKVLGGTDIKERAKEYKLVYSQNPPYEVIKTDLLSYSEKLLLKDVAFLTEKIYNSGSFEITLALLLKQYPSPFAMFAKMAEFCNKEAFLSYEHSKADYYKMLFAFGGGILHLDAALGFDYVSSLRKRPPDFSKGEVTELCGTEKYEIVCSEEFAKYLPVALQDTDRNERIKKTDLYLFQHDPLNDYIGTAIYAVFDLRDDPIYSHYHMRRLDKED